MRAKNENKSMEIKRALHEALGSDASEDMMSTILKTLDKHKMLRYHEDDHVNLLSTAGKVLVAIVEDPTMTQRAIAIYLDMSETMIDRTVKSLAAAGVVTKTKVNRQNIYKINFQALENNPDIQHFAGILSLFSKENNKGVTKENDIF
jgi:predicted transcriptional regulator